MKRPLRPRGRVSGRHRATAFVAVVALAIALVTTGCVGPGPPPIRIATAVWPGFEPLFLSRDRGYDGGNVHLVEFETLDEVSSALENGAVDGATLTLYDVVRLEGLGHDLRVVAVADFSNGSDAIVGRRGLRSLEDVQDARVGINPSSLDGYFLDRALAETGLRRDAVERVPIDTTVSADMLQLDLVDAVVTSEPYRSDLVAAGYPELFSSARIPSAIVDVIVVLESTLDDHPAASERMVEGFLQALEDVRADPGGTAAAMAPRAHLTRVEFRAMLARVVQPSRVESAALVSGADQRLLATAKRIARYLYREGIIDHVVDPARLLGPVP